MFEHNDYFDEHDEDDQHVLWQRAEEIAQDNCNKELFCEEEMFDNE